jgi:hypothetical protein
MVASPGIPACRQAGLPAGPPLAENLGSVASKKK